MHPDLHLVFKLSMKRAMQQLEGFPVLKEALRMQGLLQCVAWALCDVSPGSIDCSWIAELSIIADPLAELAAKLVEQMHMGIVCYQTRI